MEISFSIWFNVLIKNKNSKGVKMKKILTIISFLLLAISVLNAADLKVVFVNVDKIYNQLSERAEAEQQFNQEVGAMKIELQNKEQELINLKEEYDNLPPIVSEDRKEEKGALLEKKQREYYEFANQMQAKATQRQMELLQPINEKIIGAIQEISIENDYDIVLNSIQNEIVLYGKDEFDITDIVIEKLNKATEISE
ncbi:MAG: OmpH family outer membrane protein [Candidatus Cloacimonetes bacterium]|nr:OmpH family outer membrane protein [Candidatus Cloacimonadota bacterium]MBL7108435.1 OmpH family outer membrane protein [Candidatus Cloacimonadota bacterium]